MADNYKIRKAILDDAGFIADAIIGAEKSNSDKLGLATLFNISETEVRIILINMLEEGVDGCEFSLSSYLVADLNGDPVAAVAGWVEGQADGVSSSILRSNFICYFYPKESLGFLQSKSDIVSGILIDRSASSLQIEYVYVDENHRGNRLAQRIITAHINQCKSKNPDLKTIQLQVFKNNPGAIRLYEKMGFKSKSKHITSHEDALNYLPDNCKVLMEIS